MCPQWSDYSVWTGDEGVTLFKTVEEFDTYISDGLPTTPKGIEFWKTDLVCPGFTGGEVRYFQSTWCATFVDVASFRFGCNKNIPPKNLCRSTALQAHSNITALLRTTRCTANAPARASSQIRQDPMQYAINRTTELNCLRFDGTCGFSSYEIGKSFCLRSNRTEPCCSNLTAPAVETTAAAAFDPLPPAPTDGVAKWLYDASWVTPDTFYYGLAGVGAALAILIGIIMVARKNSKGREESNRDSFQDEAPRFQPYDPSKAQEPAAVAETMQAIYEYTANLFDEMTLNVGDDVIVKVKFDDGWAFGFNMNTKQEGSFPLACVGPMGASISDLQSSNPRDSWAGAQSTNRRASSLANSDRYSRF